MPTPCRGRIVEFADDLGIIETEHGSRVRMGRSSCSGFEPRVGLDVWLMATRYVPMVGERATLVNLTGVTESADPTERARQRRETEERALQAKWDAKVRDKASLRARASNTDLPPTWRPGLAALGEVIELPAPLRAISTRDERAGDAMRARVIRHEAALAEVDADVVFEQHRADGDAPVLCIGPCDDMPWLQDACLVPFARIDGDEPDAFAVFFHPDLWAARKLLPVVYWRHDDSLDLLGTDAAAVIATLARGELEIAPRPESELKTLFDWTTQERRASQALTMLAYGDEYAAIIEASEALERQYRELGWHYHARHTQFQRRRFFFEE